MKRLLIAFAAISLAGLGTAASAQPYEYYHHHDYTYYHRDGHSPAYQRIRDLHAGGYAGFSDWDRARRVIDYYRYGLYRPAPGYQWRWVDGNFVLGAVATGLISDVIPGDYW